MLAALWTICLLVDAAPLAIRMACPKHLIFLVLAYADTLFLTPAFSSTQSFVFLAVLFTSTTRIGDDSADDDAAKQRREQSAALPSTKTGRPRRRRRAGELLTLFYSP